MAKTSSIERNKKRIRLAKKFSARRTRLKAVANDESLPPEQRFAARLKLSELPRNASPVRQRNRCELTGRARARLSEVQVVAHRAARVGVDRPDPWHGQVELVMEGGGL